MHFLKIYIMFIYRKMVIQLMECADVLKILDLKVSFRAVEKITLPVFKGNVLRSALGRSLKDVFCVAYGRRECNGCMLEDLCTYRKLFPSQTAHSEIKRASMPYIASFPGITPSDIDRGCFLKPYYLYREVLIQVKVFWQLTCSKGGSDFEKHTYFICWQS